MPRPTRPPIGLRLTSTAKIVSRGFDEAMAAAGGSLPMWVILTSLKTRPRANQRELAEAVGIQGATLTHHLNAMETAGLLTRRRDPANRRVHLVELTAHGESAFDRMRMAARDFDRRLRAGFGADEVALLEQLLDRLRDNVTGPCKSGDTGHLDVSPRPERSAVHRAGGQTSAEVPAP